MSKYLNPTALITALIASALLMWVYNKNLIPGLKKVLGGQ